MNILLTNDDGHDAAGLATLRGVAAGLGRVAVVAPDVQHSMKSHAITTGTPIDIVLQGERAYRCTGTPADCIRLGLRHVPLGPVDLVISGINHGSNLGVDVFYSGTLAAAREAALLGTPAIAVSQLTRGPDTTDWPLAGRLLQQALEALCAKVADGGPGLPPVDRLPPITSINLPAPLEGRVRGVRFCPLTLAPMPTRFEPEMVDGQPRAAARYSASYFERRGPAGSDVSCLFDGWITITLLNVDHTPWQPA